MQVGRNKNADFYPIAHNISPIFSFSQERQVLARYKIARLYYTTEIGAPRDLTVPISSEVPRRGVGVNSGRKLGGDTPTIPEARRRTR